MRVKAHPTTYGGVRFRSRLEATWAAFFDLAGIAWDYEPVDFEGWVPDFVLRVEGGPLYVEVKPVPLILWDNQWSVPDAAAFAKAKSHGKEVWVLLLGERPQSHADFFGIGRLMDEPEYEPLLWQRVKDSISPPNTDALWVEAKNRTQWRGK